MTRSAQLQRDRGNPRLKFLDRYVGIPAVAVLGVRRRMRGTRAVPTHWRTIGLMVTAGIGDVVLLTGVINDIRAARPDARIVLFVTANNASFARLLDTPDKIVELPVRHMERAVREMRAEHCDVIIDFAAWRRFDEVIASFAGARLLIGRRTEGQYRHYALDVVVDHQLDHEIDNDRRLVAALGITSTSPPSVPFDPSVPAPYDRPYVVLHLWPGGANFEERSWPTERWFELAQGLATRGLDVVLTGGPEDVEATEALTADWRARGVTAVNAAGGAWVETVAWLRHAAGAISVNTGVMHVAAGLDVPTIALNGPTSGTRWGPIGLHTRCVASPMIPNGYLNLGFEQNPKYRDAMRGITVPMVLGAWDDMSREVASFARPAAGSPRPGDPREWVLTLSVVNAYRAARRPRTKVGAGGKTMNAQREAAAEAVVVAPSSFLGDACRRAVDIVGAGILLVLFSPVLAAAAAVIWITSRGPILFWQERVGKDERIFMVVKLRTMVVNHAKVIDIARVEALERDGILSKSEDDPRITRVGKFLRRTSIDELPQLWNVLTGDMSLIGPRPLIPFMLAPYPELRRVRCTVRPGLTGLWQVSTRSDNTTALAMADADLEYIATRSLRGDMSILVRTVPAILKGSGAM